MLSPVFFIVLLFIDISPDDHHTEGAHQDGEDQESLDSKKIDHRTAEQCADDVSEGEGHGHAGLAFDRILLFHDGVYVVNGSNGHQCPCTEGQKLGSEKGKHVRCK